MRRASFGLAAGCVAAACLAPACKVNSFDTDAYAYPDLGAAQGDAADAGAADTEAADAADASDAGPPCVLLRQLCADPDKTCYPLDGMPGQTQCQPAGTASASSFCASSTECDVNLVCVFVAEADLDMCAPLCDPAAAATGCLKGSVCRLIPGYQAGFCTP